MTGQTLFVVEPLRVNEETQQNLQPTGRTFIAVDTVEEKILTLQDSKRQLADALLADSAKQVRNLTAEDLEVLFS